MSRGGKVAQGTRFKVLHRDGHRCVYCGVTAANAELVVDHVIPYALGGRSLAPNLVTACNPCNPCNTGKSAIELAMLKVDPVDEDAWAFVQEWIGEARMILRLMKADRDVYLREIRERPENVEKRMAKKARDDDQWAESLRLLRLRSQAEEAS
jgi:hypothetical protein